MPGPEPPPHSRLGDPRVFEREKGKEGEREREKGRERERERKGEREREKGREGEREREKGREREKRREGEREKGREGEQESGPSQLHTAGWGTHVCVDHSVTVGNTSVIPTASWCTWRQAAEQWRCNAQMYLQLLTFRMAA